MLNSLDLPTEPSADARRRRHVGRRRFVRRRGPPQAGRLRRHRHHAAALRPWRGSAPQGRLLRRAGHPRCPPGRGGDRHPALRARLRGAVPRGGDRPLRPELSRRRDAHPLRRVQPLDQVPRPPGDRAGPRRRCRWRRATTWRAGAWRTGAAPCTARPIRTGTRATSCMPPRPSSSISCAFPLGELPKDETRALARELRPRRRRQGGQPGHLLRDRKAATAT